MLSNPRYRLAGALLVITLVAASIWLVIRPPWLPSAREAEEPARATLAPGVVTQAPVTPAQISEAAAMATAPTMPKTPSAPPTAVSAARLPAEQGDGTAQPTVLPSPSIPVTDSQSALEASLQAMYLPLVDQRAATEPMGQEETPEARDQDNAEAAAGLPAAVGSPTLEPLDLADWPALALSEWPRPVNDNGLCIHNITEAYYHEENLDTQIRRLQQMNMRWTLMLYGDENQLLKAAPRFRDAGIMVVWRKMLRPYERYFGWGRDIELLRELGVEPYLQVYNEPSLPAEWDGDHPMDQAQFLDNFVQAARDIYNAGGYVGLQFVSDDWLVAALEAIQARDGERIFGRTFLIPHPYGLNHPPDYTEDANSVLGFLHQAEIVREHLGFVPPMIAGEGGWKWNASDDRRFPNIDASLHRDYHLAAFDWFRTGILSNGEPLPDYLFAFCPWLLSSKLDDSAWFDSFAGDHTPTIEAVMALPAFRRQFSWDTGG